MTPQEQADIILMDYQALRDVPSPLGGMAVSVAVREILKAHGMTNTTGNTDELLLRLAADRKVLLAALKELIFPTEAWNEAIERVTGEQPVVNDALIQARAAIAQAEKP